jgi:hypothetical protein
VLTHARALVALCAFCAAGCGSGTSTVSGTVAFGKQPLSGCTIALYCSDQQILHTRTDRSGRYTVENVPAGPVRVTVQARRQLPLGLRAPTVPPALPKGEGPIAPLADPDEATVPIPFRYAHPEESGLVLVAGPARVTFDIALSP